MAKYIVILLLLLTFEVSASETNHFCGKLIYVATASDSRSDWVSSLTLVNDRIVDNVDTEENETFLKVTDDLAIQSLENRLDLDFYSYGFTSQLFSENPKSIAAENLFFCLDGFEQRAWRGSWTGSSIEKIRIWLAVIFVDELNLIDESR